MRITISGKAGSGKSTISKLLAQKLNLKHYSIGDLMRAMALEKGISIIDMGKLAEKDRSIDLELDNKLKVLGKKEDNFVVDGRLAAFFIPHANVRVFLEADDNIRAERIHKDKRQHEQSKDIKEMIDNINKREESEKKRYKEYYNVDYADKKLYNFVVNTNNKLPPEIVDKIIKFVSNGS